MVRQRYGNLGGQTIICCAFCKESAGTLDKAGMSNSCLGFKIISPWNTLHLSGWPRWKQVRRVKGSEHLPRAVEGVELRRWGCDCLMGPAGGNITHGAQEEEFLSLETWRQQEGAFPRSPGKSEFLTGVINLWIPKRNYCGGWDSLGEKRGLGWAAGVSPGGVEPLWLPSMSVLALVLAISSCFKSTAEKVNYLVCFYVKYFLWPQSYHF